VEEGDVPETSEVVVEVSCALSPPATWLTFRWTRAGSYLQTISLSWRRISGDCPGEDLRV